MLRAPWRALITCEQLHMGVRALVPSGAHCAICRQWFCAAESRGGGQIRTACFVLGAMCHARR